MSIFVQSASAAVAKAVKVAGVWVAWGNGDRAWDTVPVAEPVDATALVAEIGRRQAQVIEFVLPDVAGSIVVPQGAYSISTVPTQCLYVRCNFANSDAVGQEIREAGVLIGAVPKAGLQVGQDYFRPADIQDVGVLLMLERFAKITRSVDFSVSLEFVMTL
jgi:hypothetical protein